MQSVQLGLIDYAILAIYVIFVIGIGFALFFTFANPFLGALHAAQ
jgi:hypothetical protein